MTDTQLPGTSAGAGTGSGTGTSQRVDLYKALFRRYATSVSVIAYWTPDGAAAGMTATSVCPLSLDPLSLVICVNRDTRTHQQLADGGRFALNVLAEGQDEIAIRCSRPGQDKGLDLGLLARPFESAAVGPAIAGATGTLHCAIERIVEYGTHSVMIGDVGQVELAGAGRPALLFHDRSFVTVENQPATRITEKSVEELLWGGLGW